MSAMLPADVAHGMLWRLGPMSIGFHKIMYSAASDWSATSVAPNFASTTIKISIFFAIKQQLSSIRTTVKTTGY
jgi:hypothetical protein